MQRKNNFFSNPHDIETFLESVKLAEKMNLHFRFIDTVFFRMRNDKNFNLTQCCFKELESMGLLSFKKQEWIQNE